MNMYFIVNLVVRWYLKFFRGEGKLANSGEFRRRHGDNSRDAMKCLSSPRKFEIFDFNGQKVKIRIYY